MYSKEATSRAVQEKTLAIAQEIVDFCATHQLLCYLCGGGAIGALREGGFVPWDDDLDLFMPRADYERFCQLWSQRTSDRFVLEKANADFVNHNNFVTVRDSQTTFVKTYQQDLDVAHGIAVDIFPLDVAPTNARQQKIQKLWAMVYALFSEQVVPENNGGIIALGSKVLLGLFHSQRSRYRVWRFAEKQMTKYNGTNSPWITELCVGPKYMGNLYRREWFASNIMKPFEDTQMPIPAGYDQYLRQVFGEYTKRPPESAQHPHHDAVFIDPQTPYSTYRGKYFLTQKGAK
ncbi:LicD family protein [Weissella confusa]|uniref:LicD family protein n=1 Tax=Weissella confusa TaxID=1583 RepID=UPI00223BF329|nr:LicD family protein [Weissella confusa]MCT0006678.1 2-C-methyl-D-erythritol 4-phosphate cytidylyltransferase [Weissella confusa]MCT0019693.1 2-C-methyl-D-erythritol 4-phosphate cytidylyltransferase [Weissella confusa]MCT0039739.1 2-C-methyl-D-erythritol 4-phosphate cytidylyltransferase [Weissella confusa]